MCVLLAGRDGFTKKNRGAMVCHCCAQILETGIRQFGAAEVALEGIKGRSRLTGVFRDIPADRRVPDLGVHRRVPMRHGGKSRSSAERLVQGVVDVARNVAHTARPVKWGAEKANAKGQVRIELGPAAHFVQAKLWCPLPHLVAARIGNHQVGAMPRPDVCREWCAAFIAMSQCAWLPGWTRATCPVAIPSDHWGNAHCFGVE